MEISGKANFELSEDISHERLSEYEKNQRKYTQKKPTTPKVLSPVGATTNEMVANQVKLIIRYQSLLKWKGKVHLISVPLDYNERKYFRVEFRKKSLCMFFKKPL